ncbi:MAG TPA: spermidine synthase [Burkholderiaceae bacterium]|jgi:spermidine synthase|nr:spermidine synthase [Burkholderiaceae bacterium]
MGLRPPAASPPSPSRPAAGITLSESAGVRYLHFGTEWIQGAMRIAHPDRLELEYQQQMMAPLLLLPRPRRILQLGLGAAALTKFCRRHLPFAETVVVELDQTVIGTARRWFALPEDEDGRLTVVCDDALAFLQRPRRRGYSDWLQVDLYDARARGPVYDDLLFYLACRQSLREPGIATFNLFGRRCGPSLDRIAAAFDGRVIVMDEARAGNRIAVAAVGPTIRIAQAQLRKRALAVEAGPGLPARRWLKGLRRHVGPGPQPRAAPAGLSL